MPYSTFNHWYGPGQCGPCTAGGCGGITGPMYRLRVLLISRGGSEGAVDDMRGTLRRPV
jgi:hypothetical protein